MMTNYEAAIEAHNEAQAIFFAARAKFYALPGDASKADYAEFAAAQAAKKVADSDFDLAYEIEMNREDGDVSIEDVNQIEMFA